VSRSSYQVNTIHSPRSRSSAPHDISAPCASRRRRPLDCRFRHLSRHVSTHRQFPPRFCASSGPSDGSRSTTPYAPGIGAPDQRFPLPPLFTRRPRIAYGSSNVHDTNDLASACGIDGLHKFPVLPLTTPTRTSLVSFEPLLILLTCHCSLLFVLLFRGPYRCPA
jgi:hypothetical protein